MSPAENNTQPTELHQNTTAIRALERAVDVLQSQREPLSEAAGEMRGDVRDMRDRMARLETKVDGLPTKDWIGGTLNRVVLLILGVGTLLCTVVGSVFHILGK